MENKKNRTKRPIIIWILSILMLIGFVLSIPLSIIGHSIYGGIYSSFSLFASVVGFFSFVGIFMMKRWGLYLYVWMFIVSQIMMIIKDWWTPFSFVLPFIFIIIISLYYKRMS